MAYYDGGASSWRPPPPEDVHNNYASSNHNNDATSYGDHGGHGFGMGRAAAGGYGGDGDHRSLGGYTNANTSVYPNNHHPTMDNHTNHHPAAGNANVATIDPLSNPLDEESQVVPSSLDHLSRDELCRMIYRLDYERTAVQERLDAVRSWWRARTERKERNERKKGKEGHQANQGNGAHKTNERRGRKRARPSSDETAPKRQAKGRSAPNSDENVGTEPPSKDEVEATRTRLRDHVTAAVRATVHGGRKIPKSTVRISDVSLSMARAMMQGYDGSRSSETGRMVKWTLTEREMASMLGGERLIHPVSHDGTGYLLPHGTPPSSLYGWAKFVGGEVRYDKREGTVGMTVKTVALGSGRPETARGLAEYSRWETEELPS